MTDREETLNKQLDEVDGEVVNIEITCYDEKSLWTNRNDAINFYKECYLCSDGHEKERYAKILSELYSGKNECSDETDC